MNNHNRINEKRYQAVRLKKLLNINSNLDEALLRWCEWHQEIHLRLAAGHTNFYQHCDQKCRPNECDSNGEGCKLSIQEINQVLGNDYQSAPAYLFSPKKPIY